MAVVVKVVNGKIQEFENGFHKRTYGSNIVAADTDGHIIAAVTAKGKVEEYKNGIFKLNLIYKMITLLLYQKSTKLTLKNVLFFIKAHILFSIFPLSFLFFENTNNYMSNITY